MECLECPKSESSQDNDYEGITGYEEISRQSGLGVFRHDRFRHREARGPGSESIRDEALPFAPRRPRGRRMDTRRAEPRGKTVRHPSESGTWRPARFRRTLTVDVTLDLVIGTKRLQLAAVTVDPAVKEDSIASPSYEAYLSGNPRRN